MQSIHRPEGIAARGVVFVGAPSIGAYAYSDIRHFGYEALRAVARAFPAAKEIALTLHGVGFGLDETEYFDAEIGGILAAVESGEVPRSLRTVSFLEFDRRRALRLRKRLEFLLGLESTISSHAPDVSFEPPQVERLRAVGTQEVKSHAFVAMPFGESLSDRFHYGFSAAVNKNGLLVERIDQQAFTGDVLQRLKDRIRTAKIVVAELTGNNAYVLLEVGFAWGSGGPTVLVYHKDSPPLAFDVQSQRCLVFESIQDLELKLGSELGRLLPAL